MAAIQTGFRKSTIENLSKSRPQKGSQWSQIYCIATQTISKAWVVSVLRVKGLYDGASKIYFLWNLPICLFLVSDFFEMKK